MTQQPYGEKHAEMVANAKAIKARMYAAAYVAPKKASDVKKQTFKKYSLKTREEARQILLEAAMEKRRKMASIRKQTNQIRCPHLTLQEIVRRVAKAFDVTVDYILENRGKGASPRFERHAAAFLCYQYSSATNLEISDFFNCTSDWFVGNAKKYYLKHRAAIRKEALYNRDEICRAHTKARGI